MGAHHWIVGLGSACLLAGAARAQGPEGPLGNTDPLPAHRPAITALTTGDRAWADARSVAAEDRPGLRTRAFDAWQDALARSSAGDGVPLALQDVPAGVFPDPDGTHGRRAEGVEVAVVRRLAALAPADRRAWIERFRGASEAAFSRAVGGPASGRGAGEAAAALGQLEGEFPGTEAAARAALARFDLAEEAGRTASSGVWIGRAWSHIRLAEPTGAWSDDALEALRRAAATRERHRAARPRETRFDATRSQIGAQGTTAILGEGRAAARTPVAPPRLISNHLISGITRSSDEPFGRGLESGIAFFDDGSALVQGSYGVLLAEPDDDKGPGRRTNALAENLLGIQRPIVRVAPSAGGWPSLPASDGRRAALVVGRAERPRNFMDIPVPPTGNALAIVARGPASRPLLPLWVMRDGVLVRNPDGTNRTGSGGRSREDRRRGAPLETLPRVDDGGVVEGWTLGRGWEFQPGPVLCDNTVFVLARCLGDSSSEEADFADQVRLLAIDADEGSLLWSRVLTSERGLQDPQRRGDAGYFASTTMPLALDRTTGTVLIGTNVGLVAAYGAADGRMLWMLRTQRRSARDPGFGGAFEGGWPGTRAPLVYREEASGSGSPGSARGGVAWFAPFDSEFAYALPAGPAPGDGSLLVEPPRARRGAVDLAAVLAPDPGGGSGGESTLVLLGRDGRYEAVLLERADGRREAAAYLAPDERFGGRAALDAPRPGDAPAGSRGGATGCLVVSGNRELSLLDPAAGFGLVTAARIPSQGVGRGGNVTVHRGRIYVVGRDTIWIYATR